MKTLQWTSLETNLWALLMTLVILCFNFLFPSCAWVTEKQRQPSLRQTISPWRTMIPPVPGHLRQVHHLSAPQKTHELEHPQCVFVIKPTLVMTVEMARQTVNKKIAIFSSQPLAHSGTIVKPPRFLGLSGVTPAPFLGETCHKEWNHASQARLALWSINATETGVSLAAVFHTFSYRADV